MKMQLSGQMRLEQKLKLAPKMIQSMEILQLPLVALEEKIEAELNSNPVLEIAEPAMGKSDRNETHEDSPDGERALVVNEDNDKAEGFARLEEIHYDYQDYMDRGGSYRPARDSGEPDKKLEALNNTAAYLCSLNDHLLEQWRLVEADEKVKAAGEMIIDFIDNKGYLSVRLEQLYNKDRNDFGIEHLHKALELVQTLDPAGVGARDIKECMLIQLKQLGGDYAFEIELVKNFTNELMENRLPEIARKMGVSVERINKVVKRLSRLDTSPGLQIGRYENHPVSADVIVEHDENGYVVRLADDRLPSLRVNQMYGDMSKDRSVDTATRQFLQQNIRSAQWLMEAIEQRKNTLLKVARSIVNHQVEFFDKGQLFLKPLPMAIIADEVGVHVATVSRAVAGKYMQCPQGVLSLRSFFSGGVDNEDGESHSWDAIRAKMQEIIDGEDKSNPLNDDEIRDKLEQLGLGAIARRTVAKYRKLMNVPTGRLRKKF
jgi:RNA polymerase sigma-54 factor